MDELTTIDLDALDAPVGRVKIGGTLHDVLPMNGVAQEIIVSMAESAQAAGGAEKVSQLEQLRIGRRIVEQIVPTLSDEARTRLSIEKIAQLTRLASEPVAAVAETLEKFAGNARRPTRKTHLAAG